MNRHLRRIAGLLMGSVALGMHPMAARAQGWSVDVSAGRIAYDPLAAEFGTNSLAGGIRYDTAAGPWVSAAVAPALGERHPFWGAASAGFRLAPAPAPRQRPRLSAGIDLGGGVFAFQDTVVNRSGRGTTLEALPFARLSAGSAYVDGFAGWRGHTLSLGEVAEKRAVFETGARVGVQSLVAVQGAVKFVRSDEGLYPFIAGHGGYNGARVQVWGHLGKWLSDDLRSYMYGAGLGITLDRATAFWAAVRQDAPDPLFWNPGRRTWSAGITRRLGRNRPVPVATAPAAAGAAVIRLPVTDAPGDAPFVAGDFNQWQPVRMQREADHWVIRLPLDRGVYHYAFRAADGRWFVPPSVGNRRDDGMGGYVAVLVVL